jgi:DNA-binding MurR/RpiR family transcriptional regulator
MTSSLMSPSTSNTSYSDLLGEIKSSFQSFHASEASIANCVLQDPHGTSLLNISQLADFSKTSVASVVRFSKAIGYKGFPEFRRALISEVSRNGFDAQNSSELDSGIEIEDSIEEVIRKIALADSRAIQTTAERLDVPSFKKVVDAWSSAPTIGIFGLASSGYVAMDLQLKLNRQGKNAIAWRDAHTALTSVSLLSKGDCLVAISHSGTTLDVIGVIEEFKARGVTIVLITNAIRSSATTLADIVLHTSARETTFRSGATSSRIAQLTVVDCLCVALAQRNWSGTKFALEQSRSAVGSRSGKRTEVQQDVLLSPTKTRPRGGNK